MDDIIYKISQEKGLSDIHFQTGLPTAIRINGSIIKQENNSISKEQISKFISEHVKDSVIDKLDNIFFNKPYLLISNIQKYFHKVS